MKISTIWATGLICLVLGVGIGILAATYLGLGEDLRPGASASAPAGAQGGMMGMGGGPPGGGPGGGGAGGAKGGPRGPSAKGQLVALVTRLDVLTTTPLSVTLTDEQKAVVAEQIAGLEAMDNLSDEQAQSRVDAVLAVLADHKDTLVAAGFRWPEAGGGGFQPPFPNPFKGEANAKALSSLQQRLGTVPAKQ